MLNDLMLAYHYAAELMTQRHEYERRPEPALVMDGVDNVREFRDAGLVDGSVAPVYLFNMLLLCSAIKPGATVIDLGCGPANLFIELALLNPDAKFIGVDLSLEMLRLATDLRDASDAKNVTFILADITKNITVPAGSADVVMSTLSLHHLPDKLLLEACCVEAARLLRPGGDVHLMDFGGLKRVATTEYFAKERTAGLTPFLAEDYRNSIYAAYRLEDLRTLIGHFGPVSPTSRAASTLGVPFLMALTSLHSTDMLSNTQQRRLRNYWQGMQQPQKKDFDAIRLFFRLSGLSVPHPKRFAV